MHEHECYLLFEIHTKRLWYGISVKTKKSLGQKMQNPYNAFITLSKSYVQP